MGPEFERPDVKAKRQFKRLKIGFLSLVDEPCMWGADAVVVKARKGHSPNDHESRDESGHEALGGAFGEEVAKRLEPLRRLNHQLDTSAITLSDFKVQADALSAGLSREAETGTEPVAKRAAGFAATFVAETVMTLAELEASLKAAEDKMAVVEKAKSDAEASVLVEKTRADAAEAKLAKVEEEVAKMRTRTPEEEDEEVLKGLPTAARDMVLKARAEAAASKADAEAANAEKVEKARKAEVDELVAKMKPTGVTEADKVAEAIVAIRKGRSKPADAEIIEKALTVAAKAAEKGGLFRSYGEATVVDFDGDPEVVLKSRTEALMKLDPNLTKEAALAKAWEDEPAAYAAYVAKRRAANPATH